MFTHIKDLQFEAKPDGPDAAFARRLQEILGGKWGEMTVANQYLYQGWNCRLPGKYKDLLLDVGTEEMGHVEMIATMITRLLDNAPLSLQEAAEDNPMVGAIYGGSNPAHFIHGGGGAMPVDSVGVPWSGSFVTASGNLMADFQLNVTAEAQGRLQVSRLFNMTDDPGVKQMLRFLLARDTMHQNMWMAAIEQLREDGLEEMPVPDAFPDSPDFTEQFSYTYLDFSPGEDAAQGRWASGPTPDGKGEFRYEHSPRAHAPEPVLPPGDPRLYGTNPGMAQGVVNTVKSKIS
ncbi:MULTISPECIES: manganese catalase family protein [Micromonospora]|uniref:Manganese catalase family protein n=1 Tax=Verrucosispora sioxanthis TaxID=2499994 RepID=A0A6M1L799_9ACTN|nr:MULTISPECIES: manganese catalase family protein [Micromonospora]MCZ7422801.1 manganese catalase family protein [Verrucosispora sp. WMMA2121]NEE63943.1 manganese catalase family protein [Verrucosispora sioxanthis]NGM13053.1 manganese catalase family protein [Verrucosispora sioxanthis]WBB90539.1 manganese catalase family protein [Verrucosispora sp. WMMC514]